MRKLSETRATHTPEQHKATDQIMSINAVPRAEIITIGDELLLGQILDTNATHIAGVLRDESFDVVRQATIGDDPGLIADMVRAAAGRADLVITTGGLGPTVDDPTRDALASAAGVELEYSPELWEEVRAIFAGFGREPSENNRAQAYVPAGSLPISNEVGTAPGFIVDVKNTPVVALQGVPREMEHLLEHSVRPWFASRFPERGAIRMRVLHCAGAGESQIDERLGALMSLENPSVGLAAHIGEVDVRLVARGGTVEEAESLLSSTEDGVRAALGDWIVGVDEQTLETVIKAALVDRGWRVSAVEVGLKGAFIKRMAGLGPVWAGAEALDALDTEDLPGALEAAVRLRMRADGSAVGVGAALATEAGERETIGAKRSILLAIVTREGQHRRRMEYGGHPRYARRRAASAALDLLRVTL